MAARSAAFLGSSPAAPSVTQVAGAMVPSSRLLSVQVQSVHHHFQAYFQALDGAATQDVSQILCPSWRNAVERPFLWFGDLHPSIFVNLLRSFLLRSHGQGGGSPPQRHLATIREIECRLRRRVPQIVQLHRHVQASFMERAASEFKEHGEVSEEAAAAMAAELAGLFFQANRLRKSVLEDILEVLDVCQAAAFLEALCQLVLRLREEKLLLQFHSCRAPLPSSAW
ncbi:unnamed protein product [Spirodela intermedia]|uniref:DOG1 domain-containing protein n=1 Tax=Spirodela intermedia TaxID=51605 RepID=A0A7I8JE27_SPIIN|nr:unnamed protein product [Spirodela intermedia]CAA6668005.1 unnamed protein product [Spirodela intermedia]